MKNHCSSNHKKWIPQLSLQLVFIILVLVHNIHVCVGIDSLPSINQSVTIPVEKIGKLKPVGSQLYYSSAIVGRRPFEVCLACRCCISASLPSTCVMMPCCFGIDCHIPNRPYGVCSFMPKTCHCNGCGV